MHQVLRRAPRLAFAAPVAVTEIETSRSLDAVTGDLNRYGCSIRTTAAFPRGTRIKVKIVHAGSSFTAYGRVIYATAEGMGIVFSTVEAEEEIILEKWVPV